MTRFPGVVAMIRFWAGTETIYSGAKTVTILLTVALGKISLRAAAAMIPRPEIVSLNKLPIK